MLKSDWLEMALRQFVGNYYDDELRIAVEASFLYRIRRLGMLWVFAAIIFMFFHPFPLAWEIIVGSLFLLSRLHSFCLGKRIHFFKEVAAQETLDMLNAMPRDISSEEEVALVRIVNLYKAQKEKTPLFKQEIDEALRLPGLGRWAFLLQLKQDIEIA